MLGGLKEWKPWVKDFLSSNNLACIVGVLDDMTIFETILSVHSEIMKFL